MDDMGIWCFDGFPGEEIIRVHTCSGYPKSRSLCSQLKLFKPW